MESKMLFTVNRNPSPGEVRKFGLTILLGLAAIGALLWWWRGWMSVAVGLWVVAVVAAVVSFSSHGAGTKLYVAWMLVGAGIGRVMLPVILTIAFLIFLPVFSLIRLSDPLRMKLRPAGSYWEPHKPHEPTLERMRRPF